MKSLSLKAKTATWMSLLICLLMVGISQAAQSSSDSAVKEETKQQYLQEIMGKKETLKTDPAYVIGYRDILYVEVYGEGSMAVGPANPVTAPMEMQMPASPDAIRGKGTGAEVGTDGRVSLRHIGDVYVVGLTLGQLADYLKKLYGTVYDKPEIITALVQTNSRQYTMMGQVKTPGVFHLDQPITVVKAIARAGGFTEWADSKVTIIRERNDLITPKGEEKGAGASRSFEFDYDKYLKGKEMDKNIDLEPGDVVVVH